MVVSTSRISRIVVKQTNSNRETFDMFNIIKIPWNYFTRELLHDSNVAFHSLAAILGGKLFRFEGNLIIIIISVSIGINIILAGMVRSVSR